MKESELLQHVLSIAEKHNVLAFHCFDSRQTAGAGFPDIVLSSPIHTLFAELKVDDPSKGYLKPEQRLWKASLQSSGENWVLWRPRHLLDGTIEEKIRSMSND